MICPQRPPRSPGSSLSPTNEDLSRFFKDQKGVCLLSAFLWGLRRSHGPWTQRGKSQGVRAWSAAVSAGGRAGACTWRCQCGCGASCSLFPTAVLGRRSRFPGEHGARGLTALAATTAAATTLQPGTRPAAETSRRHCCSKQKWVLTPTCEPPAHRGSLSPRTQRAGAG
uniref:Uncharacterized protein n=1 Tax=Pipistrellus kuhlii TaxID=59472 RepID=A0A7J7RDT9_PIPKU|nr:hypothetical protein mPipKuh1_010678 [Pipistrellus kuhlii]